MKTVFRKNGQPGRVTVPYQGRAYRINFGEDGKATVPDFVAEIMMGIGEASYTITKQFEGPLEPGTKILVIRDAGMGDVLLTTPLVRKLHQSGAVVDVLTNHDYQFVYGNNPYVNKLFDLQDDKTNRKDYAAVLDMRLLVENAEAIGIHRHRVDAFCAEADIVVTPAERHLDYFITKDEVKYGKDYVKPLKSKRRGIVAYVWRASRPERSWSLRQHKMMLVALSEAGYAVVILDGERMNMQNLPDGIHDATGRLGLRELAGVMKACDCVVTPDTGLFHLASALDCKVVTYFATMPIAERATHSSIEVIDTKERCGRHACRQYQCRIAVNDYHEPKCLDVSPRQLIQAVQKSCESEAML